MAGRYFVLIFVCFFVSVPSLMIMVQVYEILKKERSEKEKEGKSQYHCEHNKNISEEQKQKLVEYMRSYYLAHEK